MTPTAATARITSEAAMLLALRDHFRSPEYALLPQVRNSTGYSSVIRTADALVMGLWPSRGIYLHGIEIKVSRADWAKEKRSPEKADEIAKFCDFWWLAAGFEAIVQDGELPEAWGLLIPDKNGKLRVKKPAVQLQEPAPVTRQFLAAILRKTVKSAPVFTDVDAEVEKRVQERLEPKLQECRRTLEWQTRNKLDAADKLTKSVEAFEAASGIRIDRYGDHFSRKIGDAVQALRQAGGDLSIKRKLAETERVVSRLLEDLKAQQAALERVWPEPDAAVQP
jgi:hypothetical protein